MVYLLDQQHGNDEHDMSDIMLQLEKNVQSGNGNYGFICSFNLNYNFI